MSDIRMRIASVPVGTFLLASGALMLKKSWTMTDSDPGAFGMDDIKKKYYFHAGLGSCIGGFAFLVYAIVGN